MSRKVGKHWFGYDRKLKTREYICEHCKKQVKNLTELMHHRKSEHSNQTITLKH